MQNSVTPECRPLPRIFARDKPRFKIQTYDQDKSY